MLFNPKHKKIFNGIFIVVGILIILSMVILYFPSLSSN
jgi:predicted nucleic acid-binding Zn ribbon protein